MLPISFAEAAGNSVLNDALKAKSAVAYDDKIDTDVKKDRRRDMNALKTVRLYQQLDIISDFVAPVQTPVAIRLVGDLEKTVDLLLIKTDPASKLRQPLVGLIARLVHDISVEVFSLLVEKSFAENPEERWVCL